MKFSREFYFRAVFLREYIIRENSKILHLDYLKKTFLPLRENLSCAEMKKMGVRENKTHAKIS